MVRWHWTSAVVILLGVFPATAAAQDRPADRASPRQMLKTFYHAVTTYDLVPARVRSAIDCLELRPDQRDQTETGALLALSLGEILGKLDLPLFAVPDRGDGKDFTLINEDGLKIVLARGGDGGWRFDADTVGRVPAMSVIMERRQREVQRVRAGLAEGRTDPETTMRRFLLDVARRNFLAAAQCLDLSGEPYTLRPTRGPQLARKLAFVIQRCGFVYLQEVPSDPDAPRYTWHASDHGRIMLERVRLPDGKEAWLFSRGTLANLDALVEAVKNRPPDPIYAELRMAFDANALAGDDRPAAAAAPPPQVPAAYRSARATLKTFFEAVDEFDFTEDSLDRALGALDLSYLPEADRRHLGFRLASRLEAILRQFNLDLLEVSDNWDDEPQTFTRTTPNLRITVERQNDGAWRIDEDTLARIPEMYSQLSAAAKAEHEHRSDFSSARETMRTFLYAVNRNRIKLAAQCLDLSEIPPGAREEVGPTLAFKLKFIIDRLGRVYLQEIPGDTDGPRYFFHRSPLGRVAIARRQEEPRQGEWLFTTETVAGIDRMFRHLMHRPPATEVAAAGWIHSEPSPWQSPEVWLRWQLPGWLQEPVGGLDLYQWIGLVLLFGVSYLVSRLLVGLLGLVVGRVTHLAKVDMRPDRIRSKLRPLGWLLTLWLYYLLINPLDLPIEVESAALPIAKFVWTGLVVWSSFRLIDLGMALYTHSEHLHPRRNLSDMIVPTAVRGLKLVVVLVAVCYLAYVVGSNDLLTKLLAGLGLLGLAASLASQDSLKNFFGTLLLISERPFKIGDGIVVNNLEGVVESVGFRSTRLRTGEDSLVTIPNSVITTASIENRGVRTFRRYRTFLTLAYGTPIDKLLAVRDELRHFAKSHPKLRPDKIDVHIHTLSTSSVDVLLNLYIRASSLTEELEVRDEVNREMLRTAERLGVEIAFPTQTVHLASPPPAATGCTPAGSGA